MEHMMKKGLIIIMAVVIISTSGCAHTYRGRVIDAETKEPIEGAAVVVYWNKEKGVFIDTVQKLKKVKETLTDKNGEWTIKGPKGHDYDEISPLLVIVSHIPFVYYTIRPEFIVFKPGYCSVPKPASLLDKCKGMKFIGGDDYGYGATIELPRLTEKEDRKRARPGKVGHENKWFQKQKEFIKLIEQEKRYIYSK
jgi:hypothetical protein